MKSEPISNVLTGIRSVVRGERFLSPNVFGQTPHGSPAAAVESNRPTRPGGGGLGGSAIASFRCSAGLVAA